MAEGTPAIPGWKTSEFWMSLGAVILSSLFASGLIPTGSWVYSLLGAGATILTALGYTVSRTLLKKI